MNSIPQLFINGFPLLGFFFFYHVTFLHWHVDFVHGSAYFSFSLLPCLILCGCIGKRQLPKKREFDGNFCFLHLLLYFNFLSEIIADLLPTPQITKIIHSYTDFVSVLHPASPDTIV